MNALLVLKKIQNARQRQAKKDGFISRLHICNPVALGGVSKKPDEYLHSILVKAPLILFSLDYDEAGIKAFAWWKKQYKTLSIWVTPFEKSIGDAFLKGLDVKIWISLGIERFLNSEQH